jgi:1-acyl-sn-glycerol-3-phosphate acyltransferase
MADVSDRRHTDRSVIPPFHWWRTVFFLIPLISVYTIVLGTLSIVSSLFEQSGHFAHWCARIWSHLILMTTGVRVHTTGLDRLERGKTYIFVSNHQSIYDIPIIFASLPFQVRIIAKESLGSFPFLGWHLRRTGHLLVDRRVPDHGAILARWRELVTRGVSLVVFPEGTRSLDGRVGRFRAGSFLLALEAGLPLVPVSVSGSRHVMRKGRLMTCPGDVALTIHESIEPPGLVTPTVRHARDLAARARSVIQPLAEQEGEVGHEVLSA